jgi:hypothetical protein
MRDPSILTLWKCRHLAEMRTVNSPDGDYSLKVVQCLQETRQDPIRDYGRMTRKSVEMPRG